MAQAFFYGNMNSNANPNAKANANAKAKANANPFMILSSFLPFVGARDEGADGPPGSKARSGIFSPVFEQRTISGKRQ